MGGDPLGSPDGAEVVGGAGGDGDRRADGHGEPLGHLVEPVGEPGSLGEDGDRGRQAPEARRSDVLDGLGEQHHRVDASQRRVVDAELPTEVADPRPAEQRVDQGVDDRVGIGVAGEAR